MTLFVLIVAGGGVGAGIRWLIAQAVREPENGFPLAITLVNVVGSFALGVLVGADTQRVGAIDVAPLTVGALGGFTTFSTWMVDIDLAETGNTRLAIGAIPFVLGMCAASFGLFVGSAMSQT